MHSPSAVAALEQRLASALTAGQQHRYRGEGERGGGDRRARDDDGVEGVFDGGDTPTRDSRDDPDEAHQGGRGRARGGDVNVSSPGSASSKSPVRRGAGSEAEYRGSRKTSDGVKREGDGEGRSERGGSGSNGGGAAGAGQVSLAARGVYRLQDFKGIQEMKEQVRRCMLCTGRWVGSGDLGVGRLVVGWHLVWDWRARLFSPPRAWPTKRRGSRERPIRRRRVLSPRPIPPQGSRQNTSLSDMIRCLVNGDPCPTRMMRWIIWGVLIGCTACEKRLGVGKGLLGHFPSPHPLLTPVLVAAGSDFQEPGGSEGMNCR